jgi:hypothetical protein
MENPEIIQVWFASLEPDAQSARGRWSLPKG